MTAPKTMRELIADVVDVMPSEDRAWLSKEVTALCTEAARRGVHAAWQRPLHHPDDIVRAVMGPNPAEGGETR